MNSPKVDRTCWFCGQDHGSLKVTKFYDAEALIPGWHPNMGNGGHLNSVLTCGREQCRTSAMAAREQALRIGRR